MWSRVVDLATGAVGSILAIFDREGPERPEESSEN